MKHWKMKNGKFLLDIQTKCGGIANKILNAAIDAERSFKCKWPNISAKSYLLGCGVTMTSYTWIWIWIEILKTEFKLELKILHYNLRKCYIKCHILLNISLNFDSQVYLMPKNKYFQINLFLNRITPLSKVSVVLMYKAVDSITWCVQNDSDF